MGYRSEVTMVIQGPALKEVMALMDAAGLYIDDQWDESEYGFDDDTFIFQTTDVKWYTMSNFAEVDMIERMWKFARDIAEERPDQIDGRFMRLGESEDDVEDKFFGNDPWELGRLIRQVDTPYTSLLGRNNRTKAKNT